MPNKTVSPRKDDMYVEAFARGLAVIKVFGRGNTHLTLSEVAQLAGMSPAGARRLLHTLINLGYARLDNRKFSLTPAILALGYSYLSSLTLKEVAPPHLEQFAREHNEICSISIFDKTEIVLIARAEMSSPLARRLATGERLPAHATATGQVLLAYQSADELQKYFEHAPFERFTAFSLTEERQLRDAVKEAKELGYAMASEQIELGVCGLAVPVRNRAGSVVAAVTTTLNLAKYPRDKVTSLFLPGLQLAAQRIGEAIAD